MKMSFLMVHEIDTYHLYLKFHQPDEAIQWHESDDQSSTPYGILLKAQMAIKTFSSIFLTSCTRMRALEELDLQEKHNWCLGQRQGRERGNVVTRSKHLSKGKALVGSAGPEHRGSQQEQCLPFKKHGCYRYICTRKNHLLHWGLCLDK